MPLFPSPHSSTRANIGCIFPAICVHCNNFTRKEIRAILASAPRHFGLRTDRIPAVYGWSKPKTRIWVCARYGRPRDGSTSRLIARTCVPELQCRWCESLGYYTYVYIHPSIIFHVSHSFDNCNLLDLGFITAREIHETFRREGCPLRITLRQFYSAFKTKKASSNGWDHVDSFPGQGYEI